MYANLGVGRRLPLYYHKMESTDCHGRQPTNSNIFFLISRAPVLGLHYGTLVPGCTNSYTQTARYFEYLLTFLSILFPLSR